MVIPQPKWCPPARECLKINFDGAFVQETNAGAWGFIERDHEGQSVLAGAGKLVMIHDALLAEAYACKHAPEAAATLGISLIILEMDSSHLKEALSSSSMDLAIGGGLFRDLRDNLLDDFCCISICNAPRVCNSVAHEIARRGLSWHPDQSMV